MSEPSCASVPISVIYPQVRSSTDYTLTSQEINQGGGSASSGTYTVKGSMGGIFGGLLSSTSPSITSKSGFSGSIYAVTDLSISVEPSQVEERAFAQLNVVSVLDTGATLPINRRDVAWRIDGGPVTALTQEGEITTDTVFEDTAAMVAATYLGIDGTLAFLVLNIDSDDLHGYSGDGLPDDWQVQFFGLENAEAAPTVDSDQDGVSNLLEYAFNLVPTDPASGQNGLPPATTSTIEGRTEQFLTLTFRRRAEPTNIECVVEVTHDFTSGIWVPIPMVGSAGAPDQDGMVEVTFRDSIPIDQVNGTRYMRVRVVIAN